MTSRPLDDKDAPISWASLNVLLSWLQVIEVEEPQVILNGPAHPSMEFHMTERARPSPIT